MLESQCLWEVPSLLSYREQESQEKLCRIPKATQRFNGGCGLGSTLLSSEPLLLLGLTWQASLVGEWLVLSKGHSGQCRQLRDKGLLSFLIDERKGISSLPLTEALRYEGWLVASSCPGADGFPSSNPP